MRPEFSEGNPLRQLKFLNVEARPVVETYTDMLSKSRRIICSSKTNYSHLQVSLPDKLALVYDQHSSID